MYRADAQSAVKELKRNGVKARVVTPREVWGYMDADMRQDYKVQIGERFLSYGHQVDDYLRTCLQS